MQQHSQYCRTMLQSVPEIKLPELRLTCPFSYCDSLLFGMNKLIIDRHPVVGLSHLGKLEAVGANISMRVPVCRIAMQHPRAASTLVLYQFDRAIQ